MDGVAHRPRAGDVVGGCRLMRPIGSGGAADVWLAVDRLTGGRMAVKVYRDGDPPAGERLRVRHPHVVAVRRIVDDPPAVVLDLAEGGSLGGLVRARGPLDVGEVATVLATLGRALGDLHERGLVHGDVAPGNVLLAGDGRPLLADLADLRVAGGGPIAATDGFAAPEAAAGGAPGPAADVHGLCAVAWFALCGVAPDPAPPRMPLPLLVPAVPPALAELLAAGLDPDPRARPTPGELVEAVLSAARCEPLRLVAGALPAVPAGEAVTHRVRRPALDDRADTGHDGQGPEPAVRGSRRARRGRRLVAVAGAGLLVGAGLAAVGLVDRVSGVAAAGPLVPATLPTVPPTVVPSQARAPDEAREIVDEVVALRERSLRDGDAAGLDRVYVRGAPAGSADAALLAAHGALDIDLDVHAVAVAPSSGGDLVVDVTLATRRAGGPGVPVDPGTDTVRLRLVPAGAGSTGGWRIAEVTEPS